MSIGARAGSTFAELLVYEPFAYADGWLTGQGGALGTTGVWTCYDTHNGDWRIHQEGDTSGIVVAPGPPVERNMYDGMVANLTTSGGYVGLPGPLDLVPPADPDEDFEIGRYMDAHIPLDPSVTAAFQSGTTTWFRYVCVRVWDRNMEPAQLQLATDPSPNESRPGLYKLTNSGNGIGAGGGPPRNDRFSIIPRYHLNGDNYNIMGAATGWTADAYTAPADAKMSWIASDDDGFGAVNIIVGKIEWDADTGGEDIISVVRFLETDTLSEAAFDAVIAAQPLLSSANWTANKPNLDQSQFDLLNFAGTKFFIDEIRIATSFADVMGDIPDLTTELVAALNALKDHITGLAPLSAGEIAAHKATIDFNRYHMGENSTVIAAGFDLVETYDTEIGPLFVSGSPVQSFSRNNTSDEDINWAVYNVMQYIMDYTYKAANIAGYEALLDGFKFGTSDFFPGHADPPADPEATYTATVDGSYPNTFGHDVMHEERPARKPTGAYLAPGSIGTVTVPSKIVGKGYQVRVGAHSWDFSNKPTIKRLDRSSLVYDINSTEVKVASPLGGGIYIEVPQYSYEGLVDVTIKNAVRSPYFSVKSFHLTTLAEWQNSERHHPAPWADFQSEKFMMQVPTSWIYNLDDPVTLMADWNKAMDATNDLMGFPHIRGKVSLYDQVDIFLRTSAYAPGYPSVNNKYNPNGTYNGYHTNYLVRGPQYAPGFEFHEMGHGYLFVKFPGEVESAVNLLHVPVWHRKFGYDLDYAFAASRGYQGNPQRTLDNTAVTWMTVFNFTPYEAPMAEGEKAYQLKGHAKFVDIARLFGWDAVGAFWYSINVDYENGIYWSRHGSDIDDLILRWCECVGVDLRPLFHFWGTHPVNPAALEAAIAAENLPASAAIYDTLVHYKSLVPADNAAFRSFALGWWGHQPSIDGGWTEREHARQWDTTNYWQPNGWDYCGTDPAQADGEIYTEATCARIKARVDQILNLYFPDGLPLYTVDAGDDMITWSGRAVQLNPTVVDESNPPAELNYFWSANPAAGVVFSNPDIEAPMVTITKDTDNPSTVTLTIAVHDGVHPMVQDTMAIDLYDDACKAAVGAGATYEEADIDQNCITDLRDYAVLAATWLVDYALTAPVVKP